MGSQQLIPMTATRTKQVRHLNLVFGSMLAMLVLVATVAMLATRMASPRTGQFSKSLEVEELAEKRAPAFKQCGGKGFDPVKCEVGCICKHQNEFFHICQAPSGRSQCDPMAAKAKANKAKKKAAPLLAAAKKAESKKVATAKAFALAAKKASAAKAVAEKAAKDKAEKGAAADRKAAAKIKAVEEATEKEKREAHKAKIAADKVPAEKKEAALAQEDKEKAAADKR